MKLLPIKLEKKIMMKKIETKAKTKDEAIEIALNELGANRDEVTIKVINPGKEGGMLGIGSEPAIVKFHY